MPSRPGQPWSARRQRHGYGARAPARAEQAARDSGDGVGVVADPDGAVQRVLEVPARHPLGYLRGDDRRDRGLERSDREPVGPEALARHSLAAVPVDVEGVVEPRLPLGASRFGEQVEPGGDRESALQHGRPGWPRTTAHTSRRRAGRRG